MKIKGTVLTAVILASAFAFAGCSKENKQAKYIFVMIGDGMSISSVDVTESYLSYKAGKLGGEQVSFTKFPVFGTSTTYSANKQITCSSAAGTAIATGHKTKNGMLGVDPEGNPLRSMAYALRDQGYKVGIMSTVPLNHATPAAFYANSSSRDACYDIAMQIPESRFNFFAGSGFMDMTGRSGDLEPIDEVLESKGYDVCYGLSELNESEDTDGVILLAPSQRRKTLNYEVEYSEKDDLPQDVMRAALDFLGDEDPFFIMYEGGEIDWVAHSNDLMGTVEAILRFDDAIKVAYEFYLKHPDETLIVVTADHETGGPSIGATGSGKIGWEKIEKDIAEGVKPGDNRSYSVEANIGWTTYSHAGGPVPVYAIGKGAERFAGRMDNTEFFEKIVLE